MRAKTSAVIGSTALAVLAAVFVGMATAASAAPLPSSGPALIQAQASSATVILVQRARRRSRTRLRVTPRRRAYRQCVDWLAVEHRPSGTVITPQMRCWWVYR